MNWREDLSGFSGRIQDCDYSVRDSLHFLIDEHKNVTIQRENLTGFRRARIQDWDNLVGESLRIKAGGSKIVIVDGRISPD